MEQREASGSRVHRVFLKLVAAGGVLTFGLWEVEPWHSIGMLMLLFFPLAWGWYAGPWRTFSRAGRAGALSVVPVYNGVVLLEMAQKPVWWTPFWLVPGVQLLVGVRVLQGLAQRLGRSAGWPIALFLGVACPFYYFALAYGAAGLTLDVGPKKTALLLSLAVKALLAGLHISFLVGCLPLGLGRLEPGPEPQGEEG